MDSARMELPPGVLDRLRRLVGYTWDHSMEPFHSSYDIWHVFGTKHIGWDTNISHKASSRSETASPEYDRNSPDRNGQGGGDCNEKSQNVGLADVEVVAHISVHALREERAYHICKALTSTADPNGYHVLQPLDILRLASQHDDDSGLFVCISECAGPNYLSSVIDYGPAWYNLHGLRTGNVVSEQMSLQTFLNFAIGAAECIEILHGQQIVHGEIRGDAFHMDIETGRIRLLNVGAGLRTFEHDLTSTGWSTMSKEPGAIMKLSYMSPEQTGRMPIEPDSRTDIYSLGILFWTMLLQQPAFIGETPMAVIQAVLGQRLPSVSTVRLDIPEVIGRIIQRATAKTASERYHSASGIRHDLVEVLRLLGTGDTAQLLNWEIATKDVSPSFTLPEAIIGRAAEHDAIINVIDNALKLRQIGDIHDKSGINYMSRVSGSHVASLDTAFSKWCELIP